MKGDVALAGFVLTAEEWQALDPASRAALEELNHRDTEIKKQEPEDRGTPAFGTSVSLR